MNTPCHNHGRLIRQLPFFSKHFMAFFSFYRNEAEQFFFIVNNETEKTKTFFDKSHFTSIFPTFFTLKWTMDFFSEFKWPK